MQLARNLTRFVYLTRNRECYSLIVHVFENRSFQRIKLSHDPRMVDRIVFLYDRLRKRASRDARPDTVRHPIWPRNPGTGIRSDEPANP